MFNKAILLSIWCMVLFGCNNNTDEAEVQVEQVPPQLDAAAALRDKDHSQAWQQLTVKYIDLEGGFFALISDDGQKYLPLNLAKSFRQDGAIVKVKGQLKHDVITIYQWGTPMKISAIELIKAGKTNINSQ